MTTRELLLLGAAAVVVFWMVGAYNRVMALRNRIVQAWAQVDEPLRRRRETLPPLLELLRAEWPEQRAAVEAVAQAQQQAAAAGDTMKAKPAHAEAAAQFVAAEHELASTLERLRTLLAPHEAVATREDVAGPLRELQEADQRLAFARQLFNDAVATYNTAAHQWPTRLLVLLYGLKDAGTL